MWALFFVYGLWSVLGGDKRFGYATIVIALAGMLSAGWPLTSRLTRRMRPLEEGALTEDLRVGALSRDYLPGRHPSIPVGLDQLYYIRPGDGADQCPFSVITGSIEHPLLSETEMLPSWQLGICI
jgi:hypothetical protein